MRKNSRFLLFGVCECIKTADSYYQGIVNKNVRRRFCGIRQDESWDGNSNCQRNTNILWNKISAFWTTSRQEQFFSCFFVFIFSAIRRKFMESSSTLPIRVSSALDENGDSAKGSSVFETCFSHSRFFVNARAFLILDQPKGLDSLRSKI